MATLFALIVVALVTALSKFQVITNMNVTFFLQTLVPLFGVALIILTILIQVFKLSSLQRGTKQLSSAIFGILQSSPLYITALAIPLAIGLLALFIPSFQFNLGSNIQAAIWFVLFGLSIDSLLMLICKVNQVLNPEELVSAISKHGSKHVDLDKSSELLEAIDSLTEISMKSLHQNSIVTSREAVDQIRELTQKFLQECRRKKFTIDSSGTPINIIDKVNYVLVYIFQDLGLIYSHALNNGYEPPASEIILTAGKIALYGAKTDPAYGIVPLHHLGKFALEARRAGIPETVLKSSITLVEVGKSILNDPEVLQQDTKELLLTLIGRLEELTKDNFRQDRSQKISGLTAPLQELRTALKQERFANRDDITVALVDLERVLGEFDALQAVMSGMPKMPGLEPQPGEDVMESEDKSKI